MIARRQTEAQLSATPELASGTTRPMTLRANASWGIAGSAVFSMASWLTMILITKLGNPGMVGRYSLAFAITTPIALFTGLQMRALIATDVKSSLSLGDYLGMRLLTLPASVLITALVLWRGAYHREIQLVTLILLVAKLAESTSELFYGVETSRSRMDLVAKSQILRAVLSLFGIGLGLGLTGRLSVGVSAICFSWVSILLVWDLPWGLRLCRGKGEAIRPRWRRDALRRIAWAGFPMGMVMMLIALGSAIPRYFIQSSHGEVEVGIFSAILTLGSPANAFIAAIGQAASPRLARLFARGDRRGFLVLLFKLLGLAALVGILGFSLALLAGTEVLTLVYRPEYARPALFCWAMVFGAVSYLVSVLGYGLTAMRRFWSQLWLFTIQVLVLTVACAWLVPAHGLMGALAANLISSGVGLLALSILIFRALPVGEPAGQSGRFS